MRSYVVKLALAASLTFVSVAHAAEQDPITTGSISPARSVSDLAVKGELGVKSSVRTGFGFSPFLEEGLAGEVPPARRYEVQMPVPTYLREFRGIADPL
jgi:hypothetical protein